MIKILSRLLLFSCLLLAILAGSLIYRDSQRVLSYRSLVRETLSEINQNSQESEDLILAMIYTESKGRGQDILQASESITGSVGHITSPKESLRQGVSLLASNLQEASQTGTDFWTAVQAYNFGSAYISYISQNGGKTSIELAKTYSRDVVAPSLGNTTEKTYGYYHPIALIKGEGKLYENGGNFYYAEQVKLNLIILKLASRIIEN